MKYNVFLVFFLLVPFLWSDQVELKDGTILKGEILKVHEGKLLLKSLYLGELEVVLENVANYKTDAVVTFRDENGKVENGQYDSTSNGQVKTLWSGENDPEVFINHWEGLVWFNLNKKEGNRNESAMNGGFEFTYLREYDTLTLYARFVDNTTDEEQTSDDATWGADYEKRFGLEQLHSWYLRAEYETDKIKGIDLTTTYATGYGYYFIKEENTKLRGRAGILYREENYINDATVKSLGLDFGLNFEKTFWESITWFTELTYDPGFDDLSNFRLYHESGVEIPMQNKELSLKAGVRHEYDGQPAESRAKMDTTYFMRLQYKF